MTTQTPHILLVDDEPLNLEILSDYMSEKNYQISMAEDGQIAWNMMEADPESYDVILLDRMMPNMDGMEVLERVKANPILRHCPVILQTALDDKDDVLAGMRAGAYYYLTKPFAEEQLFTVVDTAVQDRMQYRALKELLNENCDTFGLMNSAAFQFQTVKQAQSMASFIAKACPQPEKVIMGLSELLVNAVEHGNLGITYAEKTFLNGEGESWIAEVNRRLLLEENRSKFAKVDFQRTGNEIEIIISDQGEGFDWEPYMEMRAERIADNHGRGIAMAGMISFSRIEYRGKGNVVHAYVETEETSTGESNDEVSQEFDNVS